MKIGEIIKDALRYPFSDWKKFLILSIVVLLSNISSITLSYTLVSTNILLITVLGIGFLFSFLVRGYFFRIIKTSLKGVAVLPEFNAWFEMFKDGIKVFIVTIVYFIPAILIILIFSALSFTSNPSMVIGLLSGALIWSLVGGHGINALIIWAGIWGLIAILFIVIIIPISWIAIAYMADNNSKLSEAFKFHEIFNKITSIGWGSLVVWYLVIGIVFLILMVLMIVIFLILAILIQSIAGTGHQNMVIEILISVIGVPYLYMYVYRSLALFYMSE